MTGPKELTRDAAAQAALHLNRVYFSELPSPKSDMAKENFRTEFIAHRQGPLRPVLLEDAPAVGGELARHAGGMNTRRVEINKFGSVGINNRFVVLQVKNIGIALPSSSPSSDYPDGLASPSRREKISYAAPKGNDVKGPRSPAIPG